MTKINKRKEVVRRNKEYLKKHFKMSEREWFDFMKNYGPPRKEFSTNWNDKNPTSGWCGGVTNSLRLSGKVPDGYIACRQKKDRHYYMINPGTGRAIDLTIYQFNNEYSFDYRDYTKSFMNVLSHDVKYLMKALGLKIDRTKFKTKKGKNGLTFIIKKGQIKRVKMGEKQ